MSAEAPKAAVEDLIAKVCRWKSAGTFRPLLRRRRGRSELDRRRGKRLPLVAALGRKPQFSAGFPGNTHRSAL